MKVEQMASMNPIPASVSKDYVICEGGEAPKRTKPQRGTAGSGAASGTKDKGVKLRPPVLAQLPTHAQMLAKSGAGRSGPVPASRHDHDDPLWRKLSIQQVRVCPKYIPQYTAFLITL